MRINDLIAWGKASPVNNRNVQVLTDVLLKKPFCIDGVTLAGGTKYEAAEIEVQRGKVISMRFQLGQKTWTNFGLIQEGLDNADPDAAEPESEEDTAPPVVEPAVPVTTEDEDDDASPEDAVPATD